MFPAGEVAWRTNEHGGRVESPWAPTLGRLAQATGAHVLPMWLDGGNSSLFYAAGRLHPLLRTLRLGHEFLNKRGTTVRVSIGTPFTPDRVPGNVSDSVAIIRSAVDGLASSRDGSGSHPAAIEAAVPRPLLEADVNALGADRRLLTSGAYDVFCAEAASIPNVLREIGRLRETTFRAVGEGTGGPIDLDDFDRHYDHLFVWNRARAEIVGAYRVGATDRIVAVHGPAGLYTTTLFRYDGRMLDRLGPALELGRSFVRAEYQKNYSALLLLWKGIGRLVARSPRYRVLFGPVSISSRYHEASQQLLRTFLEQEHGDPSLADLVQAVNPPRPMATPSRDSVAAADVDELDGLIARIEGRPDDGGSHEAPAGDVAAVSGARRRGVSAEPPPRVTHCRVDGPARSELPLPRQCRSSG
jgi:putative hemolysin